MRPEILIKQSGFTIIEAMISIGLIAAAVMGGLNFIEAQRKSNQRLHAQSYTKTLAVELSHQLSENKNFYPPLIKNSQIAFYVNCYNQKLQQSLNRYDQRQTSVVFLNSVDDALSINDICLFQKGSRYQAVFWWDTTAANRILLRIFELTPQGVKNRSTQFRISF